jgi:hypothetical protein
MNLTRMMRPALLALAAVAVTGCMTYPDYRHGGMSGDYYYGRPSVEYRYRDYGPWHGGYGYPYYGRSSLSIGIGYGYPYGYGGYGYGYPWYGWPSYGYPYYRPVIVHRPPRGGGDGRPRDDDRDPPWRELRDLGGVRPAIDPEPSRPSPLTGGVAPNRPMIRDRLAPPPRIERPVRSTRSEPRRAAVVERARERQRDQREP